jgi:hypothetical protein
MFPNSDAAALAEAALGLLADPARLRALRAAASRCVLKYDWSVVAADILSVYEMVTESTAQVSTRANPPRTASTRTGAARFGALGSLGSFGGFGLGGNSGNSTSASSGGGNADEPQADTDGSPR